MEPEPEIYYIDELNVPTLKWSKCASSIASSSIVESPNSPSSEQLPELPQDDEAIKVKNNNDHVVNIEEIKPPDAPEKVIIYGSDDSLFDFKTNILNLEDEPLYPFTPPYNSTLTLVPDIARTGMYNNDGYIRTEEETEQIIPEVCNPFLNPSKDNNILDLRSRLNKTEEVIDLEIIKPIKKPAPSQRYITRKNSSLSICSRRMTIGSLCSIDKVKFTGVPQSDSILSIDNVKDAPKIPDGGWGWVVVLSSLVISMIADGISFSFGLLYMEFLNHFGESKSKTAWIGSLFMAVPLLLGPVASSFVDKYGCRAMTMLGGIISGTGFILSATLADSIEMQYLTFGCIAGCGLSLTYVTAVVSIAYWFDKKRTLATSLGACGTGIGTFVYAPMTQYWIDSYGWRGTILLLAGTFLNMCVCGALMKDPGWWIIEQKRLRQAASNTPTSHSIATKSVRNSIADSGMNDEHATTIPDIKEIRRLLINGENIEALFFNDTDVDDDDKPINGDNTDEYEKMKRMHNSVLNLPTFFILTEDVPLELLISLNTNKALLQNPTILDTYPSLLTNINDSPSSRLNSTEDNANECITVMPKQHNLSLRIRTSSSASKNYLKKQNTVENNTSLSKQNTIDDTKSGNVTKLVHQNSDKSQYLKREYSIDETRNETNNENHSNNIINIKNNQKKLDENSNHINNTNNNGTQVLQNNYLGNDINDNIINVKQLSLDETLLKCNNYIKDEEMNNSKNLKQKSLDENVIRHNNYINHNQNYEQLKKYKEQQINETKINNNKNIKNKFLLNNNINNKNKSDSLQWLKRQFSFGPNFNKDGNYLRNLRIQRNSVVYRGALLHNKKYKLRASSCPNIYRNSMETLSEEGDQKWTTRLWLALETMFDFSMFLELHFLLMSVATILLFIWFIVPYFYLGDYVIIRGMTDSEASSLLSVIGVANTIGMIALGWAGDQPWMNVTKTYAVCLVICGITIILMPLFITNYYGLMVISAAFGLSFASNYSFTPTILVELIPLERFTVAYGLVLLCQGIGNLLGPPMGGLVFDLTQKWDYSFYLAGVWIIVSGILVGIIPYTKNKVIWGKGTLEYDKESTDS